MTHQTAEDRIRRHRATGGYPRLADTEVPAGPGDAGASDAPEHLTRPPRPHPARKRGDMARVWLIWMAALVAVVVVASAG